MSNAISKAALLDEVREQADSETYGDYFEGGRIDYARDLLEMIESGTFDLPDIGELETAHQLMHARNERLERELAEAQQEIERLRKYEDLYQRGMERFKGAEQHGS